MKKIKKNLLVAALVCGGVLTGSIGVAIAQAEPNNWLAVRYEEKQTSAFVGERAELATVNPVYPNMVESVFFSVRDPKGQLVELDGSDFAVNEVGEYSVFVCVVGKDGATYAESYVLAATKSTAPIATVAPVMPVAFLEGSEYAVPSAIFTDYNTDTPSVVDYKVYLIGEDGEETAIEQTLSPDVSLHGAEIGLKYVSKSSVTGQEIVLQYDVPVLESYSVDEYGDRVYAYEKMFKTVGVESSEHTQKGATFFGNGDYSFAFANKLHASFSVSLASLENYVNFESVTVKLTDANNPKECITLQTANDKNTKTTLQLNGGMTFSVNGSWKDFEKGIAFYFDNKTCVLEDTDGAAITTVSTTASGEPFTGFSSGFVNVEVQVNGASSTSAVTVVNLNGHGMAIGSEYDSILPYVVPAKEFPVKNAQGEKLIIPKALGYDVVDPNVFAGITVYLPDGEIAKTTDGVNLFEVEANTDFEILLEQIGEYTIQYYAEDVNGNSYDYGYYTAVVLDIVAPEISVPNMMKLEVAVGEELTVPNVVCSDNVTAEEDIAVWVSVICPHGEHVWLKVGDKFKFDQTGVYYVRYTVMDENHNIATVEQTVSCK